MDRPDDAARLRAIIECQREIMACGPNRERVMHLITERTKALTGASSSIIELREGEKMVYRAAAGEAESSLGVELPVHASFSGRAVLEGSMLYARDTELEPGVDLAACRRLGVRSMVCMPLRHGSKVIGVLKVASPEVAGFGQEHIATLELMTGFLSAALTHASEHEAAQRSVEMFESAFGHAGVGMALVSLDGHWMRVNSVLCEILGYPRATLLKLDFQSITHPEDLSADLLLVGRLVRGEIPMYELEKRYLHAAGHVVFARLNVSIVRDAENEPLFFVAQVQDITRARQAESEVRAFFEMSPNLLAIVGANASFERVNPAWTRLLGWTASELTSRSFLEFVHPDDLQATLEAVEQMSGTGTHRDGFRNRYRAQDGSYRWLEWNTRTSAGRTYSDARDVTEQHEQELREEAQARALADSELRFRALSEGSIQGILVAALSGEALFYVNEAAAKMFGFRDSGDMQERATLFSLMPHHSRRKLESEWRTFSAGERRELRMRLELQRIDGSPLWVDLVGAAILWDGTTALQATMIDASAQVALEQTLFKQANTDGLTGLFNRSHFERVAGELLASAEREGSSISLLMLDLDHFKSINDRFGHAGGDEALRTFARLLATTLEGRYVPARWGGEEFVVLLPRVPMSAAIEIAEQVRARWVVTEIRAESQRWYATVSIGVSERRRGERGLDELMERADRALYEAKRGGRNTVESSAVGYDSVPHPDLTTSRA